MTLQDQPRARMVQLSPTKEGSYAWLYEHRGTTKRMLTFSDSFSGLSVQCQLHTTWFIIENTPRTLGVPIHWRHSAEKRSGIVTQPVPRFGNEREIDFSTFQT